MHEIQDKCDAKHKLKAHSRKGGHSTDYTYMECSDAQVRDLHTIFKLSVQHI